MKKNEDLKVENFDFTIEIAKHYPNTEVVSANLKSIYNPKGNRGRSTDDTKKKGIYALYYKNDLKKIGKATDKAGIFHRMSQYYRGDKTGGSIEINEGNREKIMVYYFNPPEEEYWFAERRLQVIAHDCGEIMPWEHTSRN